MRQSMQEPVWRQALAGAQMLFVAFGALVLVPLITGMDPSVALFTAGMGTLIFHLITRNQVPVFLASSFAFIAPILAAKADFGLPATLGGMVAAGFVYVALATAVKLKGTDFIDRLLPPVVIAPVIMSIGLGLAPVAANMAMGKAGDGSAQLLPYETALMISLPALVTTLIVAVAGRGIFRLVPILAGVAVGCVLAWLFGAIDVSGVAAAPWLAVPNFVVPEFHWGAILFMIPVAIAPAIERIVGWFVEAGFRAGHWPDADKAPYRHEITMPKTQFVDPKKDGDAEIQELEHGLATWSDKVKARGLNPSQHIENLKAEAKELEKQGFQHPFLKAKTPERQAEKAAETQLKEAVRRCLEELQDEAA